VLRRVRAEMASAALGLGFALVFALSFLLPGFGTLRFVSGSAILVFFSGHLLRVFSRIGFGRSDTIRLLSPAGLALDFLASLGIILAITALLMVTFTFREDLLVALVLGLVVGLGLATLLLGWSLPRPVASTPKIGTPMLLAVASLIGLSLATFLVFSWPAPYPSTRGWDLNPILATVAWAIEHRGFGYLLISPFPDSAILPYPASTVQAIAGYSVILGVPPDSVFYYGVALIIALYAVGIFAVAHKLSGRILPSLLSGFAGLALSTTNIETVRTPFFLTIDMLAQMMFIALLLFYLDDQHGKWRRWAIVVVASTFLLYFYYYEIIVVGPLLLYMLFEPAARPGTPGQKRVFRLGLAGVLIGSIWASVIIQLAVPGSQLDPRFGFATDQKIFVLAAIYPPASVALFALALLAQWKRKEKRAVRGLDFPMLLEYAGFYLLLFFLPLWAIYRVEFYMRLGLVLLVASIPIPRWRDLRAAFQSESAQRLRSILRTSGPQRRRLVQTAIVLVAIVLMLVSIPPNLKLHDTYMSVDEYETAVWIRSHASHDAYIVTDPGTGYVLRGFSARNASIFFILPDGRAPEVISLIYPSLRNDLHGIFTATSSQEALNRTKALGFSQTYVVISTRTVLWAQHDPSNIYTEPIPGSSPDVFLPIFVPPDFALQFSTPTTYVFRVTP